jgi:hypothetical protein
MKGNIHKKLTFEDKFARKHWCKKAKRNYIKFAKRYNRRKLRRLLKYNKARIEGDVID